MDERGLLFRSGERATKLSTIILFALLVGGIGGGPFHLLSDNYVRIYHLREPVEIDEAIQLLTQDKLDRMITPTERHEKGDAD